VWLKQIPNSLIVRVVCYLVVVVSIQYYWETTFLFAEHCINSLMHIYVKPLYVHANAQMG